MDPRIAPEHAPSPEAIEFIRFCYRRRRAGWPELYDEMWAVASRGLYRGWGSDDLSEHGIGFSLFELPALAALVGRIVAEEQAARSRIGLGEVRAASAPPDRAAAVRQALAERDEPAEAPASGAPAAGLRLSPSAARA
jgi:hypothetical protein